MTDAEREWAYDRKSHVGRLDKGLEEAAAKDWTVVDMKQDWKRMFAFDKYAAQPRVYFHLSASVFQELL